MRRAASGPPGRLEVLHVVEATLGGLRRHVVDLILGLAEHGGGGLGLHLLFSRRRADSGFVAALPALEARGVRCRECDMHRGIHPWSDLSATVQVARNARANRIRILHGHSAKGGYVARLAAAALPGARSVYTPNSSPFRLSRAYHLLERIAGRLATTRLIAVTASERDELLAHGIVGADRIVLIPSGIPDRDAGETSPPPWPFAPGTPVVVTAGRLAAQKAPLRFVAIAAAVARAHPSAAFAWIGDGELRPRVEAAIAEAGLGARLHVTGWVDDPIPLIERGALFVLASDYESFGYVTAEAMRAGLACVASDVPGSRDLVVDGETGYLVPPPATERFAARIVRLLDDGALRARMGAAGRERWRAEFHATRMVERTLALYREL